MKGREAEALDRHITGNYGEDQFRETPADEVEAFCSQCGMGHDDHREDSREDTYGREYEFLACPPEEYADWAIEDQEHWRATGCDDLRVVTGAPLDDPPDRFCDNCGGDLPRAS